MLLDHHDGAGNVPAAYLAVKKFRDALKRG